ncbi:MULTISPECIES: hypothetical protein [Rhizobium]|uniref:Nitrate reductase gamma subunit n=1 Tax=Rhizobium esperanzae TaxID=1967781 RepID=A0A7W6UKL0_9HYPH|nr:MULTISPECIES: hypothetical protein [Rhizobium]MBB4439933.1 nitrate reductase gamma subunit [Rhizobium esperanzae]MBY2952053.1 hypothetical protein [Rhizobium leguminosarum]MDH6202500.1 nitrate reductase gamma subunit [Rhizobium leguminosarum]OAV54472.1 hypothetical protein A6U98_03155 [Rhizobium sp. WYCCWR10014]
MTTFIAVLVGVAGGIALLAAVFLFAFRRKTMKEKPVKSSENHDVFEKDPSFYSSYDQHNT